ncbi:MAG: energy transducer TonB [Fodinibius sp.]|nr:energy transducer TonB [Fodinibius sp.]
MTIRNTGLATQLSCFLTLILLLAMGCKSTEPGYNMLESSDRPDWQKEIQRDSVGFYDVNQKKLTNIDAPPQLGQANSYRDAVDITKPCLQYLVDNGSKVEQGDNKKVRATAKIEFLIDENGKAGQFYMLKSMGPCDRALANSFRKAAFEPAMYQGQPKATLVHFVMDFKLVGVQHQQKSVRSW